MRTKLTALFSALLFTLTFSFSAIGQCDIKERAGAQPGMTSAVAVPAQTQTALVNTAQTSAQVSATDPVPVVNYNNPDSFFEEGFVGTLKAGILAIIAALGAFIPGLRQIATSTKGGKLVSAGVTAFLAITVLISFRSGGLTENFFNAITSEFLPNFAYSGLLYSVYKLIIGFLKRKDKEQTLVTS
jgi:hypothetical protein